MTIHLPEDLERFIHTKVETGQFPSPDAALAEAVRLLQKLDTGQKQERTPLLNSPAPSSPHPISVQDWNDIERDDSTLIAARDPLLGSIGALKEDADLLDEIVADAYRQRREEPWRDIDL